MKKIISRIIVCCLLFSCLSATIVLAASGRPNITHVPPTDTKILPPSQTYSKDTKQALQRGSLLSTCILNISNAGGGAIGILADTMCHVDVDAIYVTIYLDQYNQDTGKWLNKEVYSLEFKPEDTEDGKLHAVLISFNETNQPADKYYRLWAYHEVEKDGKWETMRTGTDGILITSTP